MKGRNIMFSKQHMLISRLKNLNLHYNPRDLKKAHRLWPVNQTIFEVKELRKKAYQVLKDREKESVDLSTDNVEKLREEFNIQKIELELQQEELMSANFRLEKQNQKLDDLFEFAPVPYFVLDRQGAIDQMNLAAAKMLGFGKSKLLNTPFTKYVHPASQDDFYFYWQKVIQSTTPKSIEIQFVSQSGRPRYYLLNSVSYREISGGPLFFRVSATDISVVKEADMLRVSEKKYRYLFENMVNGLLVVQCVFENTDLVDFEYFRSNPAFEKLTGLDRKRNEGKSLLHLFPEHNRYFFEMLATTVLVDTNRKQENYPLREDLFVNIYTFIPEKGFVAVIFEDVTSEYRAFENLARTKILYENVVNTQKELIGRITPDTRFLFVNKAFCRFLEKNEDELFEQKFSDMIPSDIAKEFIAFLQDAFMKREPMSFQSVFPGDSPENEARYIEWTIYPFYGPAREPLDLQIVGQDITNQRIAELELQGSEEKLKTIFKILPVGVTLTDNKGDIIDCNKASEELLSIRKEEHLIRNFAGKEWKIVRPDFSTMPPDEFASVRALRENNIVENVEMGIAKGKGKITWINVSAAPIPLPNLGVAIVYTDITDRFQAQEESEEKFRNLVHNSTDAIIMVNHNGRIIEWNVGCELLFGVSREKAIGRKIWSFISGNFADGYQLEDKKFFARENLLNALKSGKSKWFNRITETEITDTVGKVKTVQSVIFPVKTAHGNLLGIVARDISEIKEAQKMLQVAKQKAEEASLSKSEFLANISHEIRTPLNAILGFTEILRDFPGSDEKVNTYLSGIEKSGKALMGLINDILDLSRLEAGKMSIHPQPLDVRPMVDDVRQIFSLKALHKELDLNISVAENTPKLVYLDGTRLKQILFNLVGNAVKFTSKGGIYIDVNCRSSVQYSDRIDLTFRVKDTGIGISPENLESIFEPFFQKNPAGKQDGSGLGLSISKRLVEMMRGSIEVKSEEGSGSEFILVLPDVEVVSDKPEMVRKKAVERTTKKTLKREKYRDPDQLIQLIKVEIAEKTESAEEADKLFYQPVSVEFNKIIDILGFEEAVGFAQFLLILARKNNLVHLKDYAEELKKETLDFNVIETNNLLKILEKVLSSKQ
jgi:PAS domain S-box-containing protein